MFERYPVFTDKEIRDLLSATLHGPLPSDTQKRLLSTAAEVPELRARVEYYRELLNRLGQLVAPMAGSGEYELCVDWAVDFIARAHTKKEN